MSRTEKFGKLARAVREWRGAFNPNTGKWIRPPRQDALPRVARWLDELGMEVQPALEKLASFKTTREFDTWLREAQA